MLFKVVDEVVEAGSPKVSISLYGNRYVRDEVHKQLNLYSTHQTPDGSLGENQAHRQVDHNDSVTINLYNDVYLLL